MSDAMPTTTLAGVLNTYFQGLTDVKIGLNTSPTPPNSTTMTFGNIVEPTGTWYSRVDAVVNEAYLNAAGQIEVDCDSVQFNYGSDSTSASETIFGYFVATVPSGSMGLPTLISQGVLATPVVMANNLNAVTVEPNIEVNPITLS